MSSIAVPAPGATSDKRRRALLLVFCCTVVGAAAQMLIKMGANHIAQAGFAGAIIAMFTNPPLFAGYCLYGFNAVLLVIALRDGELSLLYPVIALTFVWVTILSVYLFCDAINAFKIIGIALIVLGVGILGKGSRG